MISTILGKKIEQAQRFLEDGSRIPVTIVETGGNIIAQVKTKDVDGYNAIQLGFGTRKKITKPITGHIKKAGITQMPRFFREIATTGDTEGTEALKVGSEVHASDLFKPGDIVAVIGTSKGKGFAGVVKRHHFKGGPRTHGQSDRERAPGSIGQTTTPGRVYRGKRMAGRMGHQRTTVKNLEIADVISDLLIIKGLVPGGRNSLLMIQKMGEGKKFIPLYKEKEEHEESKG